MSFDSLLTLRADVLSVTHTKDAAGGQIPTYAIKYSNLPVHHEETLDTYMPPLEIGGAPTLINGHKFLLRDPGPVLTGEVVIDEKGRMLRVTAAPSRRNAKGNLRAFISLVARESQGPNNVQSKVMIQPNGDVMRQPDGELMLEP